MIKTQKILAVSVLAMIAGLAVAQPPQKSPEEQAVDYRHSIFDALGWKSGQLGVAKEAGDKAAFQKHAKDIAYLGSLITEGFIPNSLIEGSTAKAEIWENWDDFMAAADNLQAKASELASPDYDMASFDSRDFGGEACGGCHRQFKERN